MRMLSILEPGVAKPNFTPRSYTRLNSTYLQHKTQEPELIDIQIISYTYLHTSYTHTQVYCILSLGID